MTREQTVDLIHSITSLFPNWKPDNLTETVNAWNWALSDYDAPRVKAALSIYLKTNNTGFAPSVSQIIACIHKPQDNSHLTEGEAWTLVKKAIQNGIYGAEDSFDRLPVLIQQAVGSPNMLRQWAQTDTDEVNTVIMSNFQRTYRAIVDRQKFNDKVSPALSDVVLGLSDKLSGRIAERGLNG